MAEQRKVFKDYEASDVRDAYQHAHPTSWQGLISYLENHGLTTWHLTPGEDAHMIADLKEVEKDHVPFTDSWEEGYKLLKSHRNPELVKQEEQAWIKKTEQYEKSRGDQEKRA